MKKQFNARLSSEALLAIKVKAKEWDCSEAEVIERWAAAKEPVQWDGASDRVAYIPKETPPAGLPEPANGLIMPKGSMKLDDLKQLLKSGGRIGGAPHLAPGLTEPVKLLDAQGNPNSPQAPFDFNHPENGEPHRVRLIKFTHYLFHLGEDGENRLGALGPGDLERYWKKRITSE